MDHESGNSKHVRGRKLKRGEVRKRNFKFKVANII